MKGAVHLCSSCPLQAAAACDAGRDQSLTLPGQSPWAVPTPFASDRLLLTPQTISKCLYRDICSKGQNKALLAR